MTVHSDVLRRFADGWVAKQEVGVTPEKRGPFSPPPGFALMPTTIAYATLRTLTAEGWLRQTTAGEVTTWSATDKTREWVEEADAKRGRGPVSPVSHGTGGWKPGHHPDYAPTSWRHP